MKPNTASTSIGVHVPGVRVEVGDPIATVGAMGVEISMGEPSGSSSEEESSGSVEGTSTIPEVDGVWTVGRGRSTCDFVEAEGTGLAIGVGGGADVEEVKTVFFPLG